MRITDDVIDYVHDNVAVSAYVYIRVYADDNENDSCYCMYVDMYVCTSQKFEFDARLYMYEWKIEVQNRD